MREIKFRAWDKQNKEMCYNDTFDEDSVYRGSLASINISLKNDSFEFMQFTGLKDKNGKEIYEGDIVCLGSNFDTVIFDYGMFVLEEMSACYCRGVPLAEYNNGITIQGNKFGNPELLQND